MDAGFQKFTPDHRSGRNEKQIAKGLREKRRQGGREAA